MCGRFVQTTPLEQLVDLFDVSAIAADATTLQPRFNVAPSAMVAVVEASAGGRQINSRRWGLVPRWARDPSIGTRLSNARSETAWDKPSFRDGMRRHRCIVPVDGFYEWAPASPDGPRTSAGRPAKRPHLFRSQSGRPLALAAIAADWDGESGPLHTVCLLTTSANSLMEPIHDRMPVILDIDTLDVWLDADPREARDLLDHLLRPAAPDLLEEYEVGVAVNDARRDEPTMIEPVADRGSGTLF